MLTKEKERQFCELRDNLREKIAHLKIGLPNANGSSNNIRERISLLEERARRITNYFIKNNIDTFKDASYRVCRRLKGRDYDLVYSEALYRVWDNIEKFDYNRARFSTFVNMVANTKAISLLRSSSSNKRSQLLSWHQDLRYDLEDKENRGPLQSLLDKEDGDIIIHGIDLLSNREKAFIYLRYLDNPDQKKAGREAREALKVSKASISKIKSMALGNLRLYLLNQGAA